MLREGGEIKTTKKKSKKVKDKKKEWEEEEGRQSKFETQEQLASLFSPI